MSTGRVLVWFQLTLTHPVWHLCAGNTTHDLSRINMLNRHAHTDIIKCQFVQLHWIDRMTIVHQHYKTSEEDGWTLGADSTKFDPFTYGPCIIRVGKIHAVTREFIENAQQGKKVHWKVRTIVYLKSIIFQPSRTLNEIIGDSDHKVTRIKRSKPIDHLTTIVDVYYPHPINPNFD